MSQHALSSAKMESIREMTIAEVARLDLEAQIEALAEIWNYIASQNVVLPLSEAEKALLRERYAREKDLPGKPWEQIRAELEGQFRR